MAGGDLKSNGVTLLLLAIRSINASDVKDAYLRFVQELDRDADC